MESTSQVKVVWGIRITLAGAPPHMEVEQKSSRASALASLPDARQMFGHVGAELVHRRIEIGPWREDATGTEWGLRYTWADREHTEVHACDRASAEVTMRLYRGDATVALVAREVTFGEWTPLAGPLR